MKKTKNLKVIFLGGVGEIGKNMTAFEYGDEIIVVDAGLAFPTADMPGVDLVIPDVTYLRQNKDKVKGLILTHGHEDHIGAVPYILREFKIPVYGTKLTLGMVEHKLQEQHITDAELIPISNKSVVRLGKFVCEFVHVSHSVAGSVAVSITTPVGVVFVTGDFKVDYTPLGGEIMDLNRIAEIGKKGVLLLLSESTNVEREGYTMSESVVAASIDRIFMEARDRRIIIATFASNVDRLQQIIDIAVKYKRKVAISGRSMLNNIEIAKKVGAINYNEKIIVDIDKINGIPDKNLLILSTGTQGEPMSALTRMANGGFNKVKIGKNDTIIISGSTIPGNEKDVYSVINNLYRLGAQVIYDKIAAIHVSGHACREELKLIHTLLKPKFFIPVHGEYRHLKQHADLAHMLGMSYDNMVIPDIGDIVAVTGRKIAKAGTARGGGVLVDGLGVGDVGNIVLKDRLELSSEGILLIVLGMDRTSGTISSGPEIISRGFIYTGAETSFELMDELRSVVRSALKNIDFKDFSMNQVRVSIVKAVRGYLGRKIKRRPMVLPIVYES
ncbi:MAG TPA: ribonuclease J [Firmicutes bacterium]|nr:ribonuclease J [Bacillota bacterium]